MSKISQISSTFIPIPNDFLYESTSDGDKHPTRMEIVDNYVLLNNSDKGIVCFDVNGISKSFFLDKLSMPYTGHADTICKDEKGNIYISEIQGGHIYKYCLFDKK